MLSHVDANRITHHRHLKWIGEEHGKFAKPGKKSFQYSAGVSSLSPKVRSPHQTIVASALGQLLCANSAQNGMTNAFATIGSLLD